MEGKLAVVILAAGRSTRFRSNQTKLLHELSGRPLFEWVLDRIIPLEPEQIIVVNGTHSSSLAVRYADGYKGHPLFFAPQDPPNGTADALLCAEDRLRPDITDLIVLPGDAPLISTAHLVKLYEVRREVRSAHAVLTAETPDPAGYGRVIRDLDNPDRVGLIVEEADASTEQRRVTEINSGMYLFNVSVFNDLRRAAKHVERSSVKDEFYLPDVVQVASTAAYKLDEPVLVEGVNDRTQLARMDAYMQRRIKERWMREGVTFILPDTSYIHADVELDQDVEVGPNCMLTDGTSVGSGTRLIAGCQLKNSKIGKLCVLNMLKADEALIYDGVHCGPFVNLRPGTVLYDGVRVGNFVEVKNSTVGEGSKLSHLQYVGDAALGTNVNIGAGTIFCNYDGVNKHKTTVGNDVFIGSNSSLQAPLTIGPGAFIAMGSAITRDVPADALAVGRSRQENKEGYAGKLRSSRDDDGARARAALMEELQQSLEPSAAPPEEAEDKRGPDREIHHATLEEAPPEQAPPRSRKITYKNGVPEIPGTPKRRSSRGGGSKRS